MKIQPSPSKATTEWACFAWSIERSSSPSDLAHGPAAGMDGCLLGWKAHYLTEGYAPGEISAFRVAAQTGEQESRRQGDRETGGPCDGVLLTWGADDG